VLGYAATCGPNGLALTEGLAPVDGEDFDGVGDALEGDFAGLGDGPVAIGGGLAADEDLAGAGEGADAGGEPIPG